MNPFFSIIIPMYNRERFIERTINSCLKQNFENFEIIVIDDGSTDNSIEVVNGINDAKIKLICHKTNRGVGPARNTGVEAATGEWAILLDSDDELLPEALAIIYRRSKDVSMNISRMQFMGQIDTGEVSPDPPLKNEYWDYLAYIKWMESVYGHRQDSMPIIRCKTFKTIKFSNDRTLEGVYHLDFMKHFNAWTFPDYIALYHQDADNQLTKPNSRRTIEGATNQAVSGELLLKNHGESLKEYAPQIYRSHISGLATLFFLSGNRLKGIKYSVSSLVSNFLSLRAWTILIFGLIGAKPLAWLKSFRMSLS